jgi:hypothetical protein
MKLVVFYALGSLLSVLFVCWLVTYINYRVGSRHVKITLFGLCFRRIPLSHIASVSKRRGSGLAENWWNTLHPSHRTLVIRRHRGWPRNVVITPKNRYIFKAELEKALKQTEPFSNEKDDASTPSNNLR